MTVTGPARPPRTLDEVENAIVVAGLALQCARTPKETRDAYASIGQLKQLRAELRAKVAA